MVLLLVLSGVVVLLSVLSGVVALLLVLSGVVMLLLLLLLLSVVLNCVDVVLVLVLRGVGGPKWCCGVVVGPKWCGIEG